MLGAICYSPLKLGGSRGQTGPLNSLTDDIPNIGMIVVCFTAPHVVE